MHVDKDGKRFMLLQAENGVAVIAPVILVSDADFAENFKEEIPSDEDDENEVRDYQEQFGEDTNSAAENGADSQSGAGEDSQTA